MKWAHALPVSAGALEGHETLNGFDNVNPVFNFFDGICVAQVRGQVIAVCADGSIRLIYTSIAYLSVIPAM